MSYAKRDSRVAIALERCAASVKRAGSGKWEFVLINGKPLGVFAHLFEDWLMLDAPVGEGVARGAWWELLRLNDGIAGLSRFAVAQQVHLRADIPLADDEDEVGSVLTTRLLETCTSLKRAVQEFRGQKSSDTSIARYRSEQPREPQADDLRQLCSGLSWPFIERSAGKLMMDLEVRTGFYQATIEHQDDGVCVSAEILQTNALSEASRQALALLLLSTSAQVKLARPSVEENEESIEVRFEVRFATPPRAYELEHAMSALSVAFATAGREAQTLQDESIARDYLALHETLDSAPGPSAGD